MGIIRGWFRDHLEIIQASFRSDLGYSRVIQVGGSEGRSPPEKQGVWGAAGPPMVGIFMNLKVPTRGTEVPTRRVGG